MPESEKPRLFISHAGEDKAFVHRLVDDLAARELGVFIDDRELKPGDSIVAGIERGLGDSDYFIVVLSKASAASKWVSAELNAALMNELSEGGTVVIPILLEDCEIPRLLRDRVYADFSGDYDTAFQELLRSVDNEAKTSADVLAKRPETVSSGQHCATELARLSLGDLRRRLVARLSRPDVADVWSDVLETDLDDEQPGHGIADCVRALIHEARRRNKIEKLLEELCKNRPDLAGP